MGAMKAHREVMLTLFELSHREVIRLRSLDFSVQLPRVCYVKNG